MVVMVSQMYMNRRGSRGIVAFFALLSATTFGQSGTVTSPASRSTGGAVGTTLCELAARPERFNDELVQIRATVVRGMESTILFDATCNARVSLADPSKDRRHVGEYAFIQSKDDVKHPTRLRWRRPAAPVTLLQDDAYKRFGNLLMADRPQTPGVLCVACPLNSVTATFIGRFEHASMTAIKGRSGRIEVVQPIGFGHLNMWDSQLVLQSVSDIVAKRVD